MRHFVTVLEPIEEQQRTEELLDFSFLLYLVKRVGNKIPLGTGYIDLSHHFSTC